MLRRVRSPRLVFPQNTGSPVAAALLRPIAAGIVILILAMRFGASTAISAEPPAAIFPRALVKTEDVAAAIRTEWELRKFYEVLPQTGESWFVALPGNSNVLVSAPHATAQTREGKMKFADAGTGALAVTLNALAKARTLYTTRMSPTDPNFYDDNAYKQKLKEMIAGRKPKLVLDLHASHWYRPYDIDFGTMNGQSIRGHHIWVRRLAENLGRAGFRDFSQDYFPGATNQTVTKFVHGLGVPCLQLEINETWLNLFNEAGMKIAGDASPEISEDILRVDRDGAHRFASTVEALVRFIRSFDPELYDRDEQGDNQ